MWDLKTSEPPKTQPMLHKGAISSIAYSTCGEYVAAAADNSESDPIINVWKTEDLCETIMTIPNSTSSVITCIIFYKDSKFILTGHNDGAVCMWNINTQKQEEQFSCIGSEKYSTVGSGLNENSQNGSSVTCLAFSKDGKVLIAGTRNGRLVSWNMSKKTKLRNKPLTGHYFPIAGVIFTESATSFPDSQTDKYLITVDETGMTIIRDYRTLDVIKTDGYGESDEGEDKEAELCCLGTGQDSSQSLMLVRAYTDGKIRVCSIPELEQVSVLENAHGHLTSVNYLYGRLITTAAGNDDGSGCVQIWDKGVCIEKVVCDSGITSATVMYVNHHGLLLYGCENGYIGTFLYEPQPADTDKSKNVMLKMLQQSHGCKQKRLSEASKSRISQTTLHSLKEVQEMDASEAAAATEHNGQDEKAGIAPGKELPLNNNNKMKEEGPCWVDPGVTEDNSRINNLIPPADNHQEEQPIDVTNEDAETNGQATKDTQQSSTCIIL